MNIKKQKIKVLLFSILAGIFISLGAVNFVQAADCSSWTDICYKPNVPIPITINGINFAEENVIKGGDFLASYIVAVYTYGASFAGIVAMFMLVIAGWRWLFAAGNAQKISGAKDMVSGVLVGLALLFGGQLLLRQISEDFSSIQSLSIELPLEVRNAIEINQANQLYCEGVDADGNPEPDNKITECSDYDEAGCLADVCGLVDKGFSSSFIVEEDKRGAVFDNRCRLYFVSQNLPPVFDHCAKCPSTCECSDYIYAFYRNTDPCDCDEDGKWYDDVCED